MSSLEQKEIINRNKIRLLFAVKILVDIFFFVFGILVVLGIIMFFYSYYLPVIYRHYGPPRPRMTLWEAWLLSDVFHFMIVSGIIGIIISSPITMALSKRLKGCQSIYIKQEYGRNKDFIPFLRTSNKKIIRRAKIILI